MSDVASKAEVSISTVSHVLNGTRFVSDAARDAVLRAVRETGYSRNIIARALVTSKTNTIGLAMSSVSNPYFGDLVRAIQDAAEARGYTLLITDTHDDPQREAHVVRELHERRVDGVLLAASADADNALQYLEQQRLPVVLVDRMIAAELDQIGTENVDSTAGLVQHLAQAGHRRIALIGGLPGLATTEERIEGYRRGLRAAGLRHDPRLVLSGGSAADPASKAVLRLLGLPTPPTAVIVGNNHMTVGAMRALRDAGLVVPRDMGLVCFDDFEWADLFSPRLTTVAQPCRELGAQAVQLLLSRISDPGQKVRRVRLKPQFIHRDSCGCNARAHGQVASPELGGATATMATAGEWS